MISSTITYKRENKLMVRNYVRSDLTYGEYVHIMRDFYLSEGSINELDDHIINEHEFASSSLRQNMSIVEKMMQLHKSKKEKYSLV